MPPPKKLDLVPSDLRERLKSELEERGFGDIVEVTDALNGWLDAEGLELTISKSAVGRFNKLLKNQAEASDLTKAVLSDLDLNQESEMHRTLMHLVNTHALQLMNTAAEGGREFDTKELNNLSLMLKNLMGSAGIREKLLADEAARIAREANAKAAEQGAKAAREAGLSDDAAERIKADILGVAA